LNIEKKFVVARQQVQCTTLENFSFRFIRHIDFLFPSFIINNEFKQSQNTSSARVDEHGRFLHFSELFDVEQVLGFRSQRTVDNHEIRF
jgi:hypothetical protein